METVFTILEINFDIVGWGLAVGIFLILFNVASNNKSQKSDIDEKQSEFKLYTKEDIFQSQNQYQSHNQNNRNIENRKHVFPALLSFFIPGLGQIIKGHYLKGILIWLVGGLTIFIFSITIILIPFAFFIWAWNIFDAYNSN